MGKVRSHRGHQASEAQKPEQTEQKCTGLSGRLAADAYTSVAYSIRSHMIARSTHRTTSKPAPHHAAEKTQFLPKVRWVRLHAQQCQRRGTMLDFEIWRHRCLAPVTYAPFRRLQNKAEASRSMPPPHRLGRDNMTLSKSERLR